MITNEEQLEDLLSTPSEADIEVMRQIDGPLLLLGAAGKMGPSLAHLARRALDAAGSRQPVIAVSRFSTPDSRNLLESWGIETISSDLLEPGALEALPDSRHVIFMAARKFGSSGSPALTWGINALLPALVARRYHAANVVAFSSGNVYPLVPVDSGGATEETPMAPVGEYAQSVLARERMFEYVGGPCALLRLNYAVELRYGVLFDIARKVYEGLPVDVTMGHVNVIWQGDANSVALRSLLHCSAPPFVLNLTGPETFRVRDLAEEFARRFGRTATIVGQEAPTALLNNSNLCHRIFGLPRTLVSDVIEMLAGWLQHGGRSLGKPTHFENREGKY